MTYSWKSIIYVQRSFKQCDYPIRLFPMNDNSPSHLAASDTFVLTVDTCFVKYSAKET